MCLSSTTSINLLWTRLISNLSCSSDLFISSCAHSQQISAYFFILASSIFDDVSLLFCDLFWALLNSWTHHFTCPPMSVLFVPPYITTTNTFLSLNFQGILHTHCVFLRCLSAHLRLNPFHIRPFHMSNHNDHTCSWAPRRPDLAFIKSLDAAEFEKVKT